MQNCAVQRHFLVKLDVLNVDVNDNFCPVACGRSCDLISVSDILSQLGRLKLTGSRPFLREWLGPSTGPAS